MGVHDESHNRVQHGESGTVTQHHECEEEYDGPEVGPGHLCDGCRQGHETNGEATNGVLRIRIHAQETDHAKDGKGGNVLEKHVASNDEERVDNRVGVLLVVRRVRSEVAETDTCREEDLSASCLPETTVGELAASPSGKV
jgi:hypothetical protein